MIIIYPSPFPTYYVVLFNKHFKKNRLLQTLLAIAAELWCHTSDNIQQKPISCNVSAGLLTEELLNEWSCDIYYLYATNEAEDLKSLGTQKDKWRASPYN